MLSTRLPAGLLLIPCCFPLPASASPPAEPPAYEVEYTDEPTFDREFAFGIGYSRVVFSGGGNVLDDLDALHFNSSLSFAPFVEKLPQLRLGVGGGFTTSFEDVGGFVSTGAGGVVIVKADTALFMFQPELQISWHQPLGPEEWGLFLEPGIGAGGTFAWLDANDQAFHDAGGTGDPDEWDAVFSARAFLRAGCRMPGGFGGLEASWLRGQRLDFGDDVGGDLGEFYIGVFGALRF
jgi:hypothetical protein